MDHAFVEGTVKLQIKKECWPLPQHATLLHACYCMLLHPPQEFQGAFANHYESDHRTSAFQHLASCTGEQGMKHRCTLCFVSINEEHAQDAQHRSCTVPHVTLNQSLRSSTGLTAWVRPPRHDGQRCGCLSSLSELNLFPLVDTSPSALTSPTFLPITTP